MSDLSIDFDDMGTLEALRGEIVANPDLMWLVEKCVQDLRLHMDMVDGPPPFPALPEELGEVGRCFYAFVYMAMLWHTKRFFRWRRLTHEVQNATLEDVGRHMGIHRTRYGTTGLASPNWMMLHARGMIYQLGRLQFERGRIGASMGQALNDAGLPFRKGDPCLAVHIPGYMGPMNPEACDDAFAGAREFFPRHFPEETYEIAVCHSWLLDEQLADYLPETSNILHFQRRFTPASIREGYDDDILEFVFRKANPALDDLPQNTTLERAVVSHLRSGRTWRSASGWLEL